MRRLIQNEWNLFMGRKNRVLLFVGLLAAAVLFVCGYEREYRSYTQQKIAELEKNEEDILIGCAITTGNLQRAKEDDTLSKEDLQQAQAASQLWNTYAAVHNQMKECWNDLPQRQEELPKLDEMLDKNLENAIEAGGREWKYGITGTTIYRNTERDWNGRCLLREAYRAKGEELPLDSEKPTGAYVLWDAFSGNSIFVLLLILLAVLLNYDCWAADFEQNTVRLLSTLPYSKSQIFAARFFTRLVLTLLVCGAPAAVLFLLGSLRHGIGGGQFVIASAQGMGNWGFFDTEAESLLSGDKVVPIADALWRELLLAAAFLIFVTSLVQMLSLLTRSQMSTLIVTAVLILMVGTAVSIPKTVDKFAPKPPVFTRLNPLLLFRGRELLLGNVGISVWMAVAVLLLLTGIFAGITVWCWRKKEV